jgi:hypothetical protein
VEAAVNTVRTPKKAVAPSAIPEALRAIWRDCCSGEDGNVSRALILNLVAVALASRLPCRAFLAVVHAGSGPIRAEVHGAARLRSSTRDLVLEQIELLVPESAQAQLPGVVRPLLVHDLPTHCYWARPWPADAGAFDGLALAADHTVVDSARFGLPASELDALDARRRHGRSITDLTWLRLRPWRRALAEVFERTAFREHAETAATIRHGERGLAGAALLGRWLEQRLAANVALEATGLECDGLAAVELRHDDAVATATWTDSGRIQIAIETPATCFLPFAVPGSRGTEVDLLAAAIDLA